MASAYRSDIWQVRTEVAFGKCVEKCTFGKCVEKWLSNCKKAGSWLEMYAQGLSRVGQNHKYTVYIQWTINILCIYIHGIFGREITKYTVIYGVYIQFWP